VTQLRVLVANAVNRRNTPNGDANMQGNAEKDRQRCLRPKAETAAGLHCFKRKWFMPDNRLLGLSEKEIQSL